MKMVFIDRVEGQKWIDRYTLLWSPICKTEAARYKATSLSQARFWRVLKTTLRRMLTGEGGL